MRLDDLGVDVPYGTYATFTGEQGLASRDLWRAISSRQLFKLGSGPGAPLPPISPLPQLNVAPGIASDALVEALKAQNALLRAQNVAVTALLGEVLGKLDLLLLRPATGPVAPGLPLAIVAPPNLAVGGEVPMFLPSTFKPEVVSASEMSVDRTESTGESALGGSLSKLREMRRGSG